MKFLCSQITSNQLHVPASAVDHRRVGAMAPTKRRMPLASPADGKPRRLSESQRTSIQNLRGMNGVSDRNILEIINAARAMKLEVDADRSVFRRSPCDKLIATLPVDIDATTELGSKVQRLSPTIAVAWPSVLYEDACSHSRDIGDAIQELCRNLQPGATLTGLPGKAGNPCRLSRSACCSRVAAAAAATVPSIS